MTDLLPCPFCGGEAKVNKWEGGFKVLCQKAFCAVLGPFNSEAEAIEAWNTRAERTCHDITPLLSDGMPYPDTFTCSECGYKMEGVVYPNYCINCGVKVVE